MTNYETLKERRAFKESVALLSRARQFLIQQAQNVAEQKELFCQELSAKQDILSSMNVIRSNVVKISIYF